MDGRPKPAGFGRVAGPRHVRSAHRTLHDGVTASRRGVVALLLQRRPQLNPRPQPLQQRPKPVAVERAGARGADTLASVQRRGREQGGGEGQGGRERKGWGEGSERNRGGGGGEQGVAEAWPRSLSARTKF